MRTVDSKAFWLYFFGGMIAVGLIEIILVRMTGSYITGPIVLIGPFIYYSRLVSAMNALAADFNARGH